MSTYIPGIEDFPHLQRRYDYELRRLGPNCQNCEIRKVTEKYKEIVSKEVARQAQITAPKRKLNKS